MAMQKILNTLNVERVEPELLNEGMKHQPAAQYIDSVLLFLSGRTQQ
jgi:hypothetical protein